MVMFRPRSFSIIRTSDEMNRDSGEIQGVVDERDVAGVTMTVSTWLLRQR